MQAQWQQVRHWFDRVVELPAAERAQLLATCPDEAVRSEVESLLRAACTEGPLDALGSRLSSLRDVLAETPPERAGPYVIDAPIGRGGMGVVYRAHDPRLGRAVALKFLPASMPTGSTDAQRLIAEARTASALDHPNICTIYDIGTLEDDRVFMAMAYYARGTLEDRLHAGPLPVAEAVTIAGAVADALDCAHAAGIVHRDVKPANVAFGERGEVKVLDFGVAVLEHDVASASQTAGTPSYMSPEQAAGGAVDARSDVWALGVLLYEMLTGQRPFAGESRAAILHGIANVEPADVAELRPDVPAPVAAIVRRALAKNARFRFASAAELRDALSGALAAATPQVRVRRRLLAVSGVVMVLSLVAALALQDRTVAAPLGMSGDSAMDEQFHRGRQRVLENTPESIEAATVILRNVLEHDSTHALARAWLAISYASATAPSYSRALQREWLDSAHVHASAAVRQEPRLPDSHAALGIVYRWMERGEEALLHHRRALAYDPDFALSAQEIGMIYSHRRDRRQAVRWLERSVQLDPHARAARRRLSAIYRSYRMYDEAQRHIAAGLQITPDDASLIWESVMLAGERGDTAAARADFNQYIQLQPPGERDRMYAWFEFLREDYHAAAEYIDRLDLVRSPWYDLRVFGRVYMMVGRHEAGQAMLRRALRGLAAEGEPPDWARGGNIFQRAYIHAGLGQTDSAMVALQEWIAEEGLATWWRLRSDPTWGELAADPRFHEVMRISEERYVAQREVIAAELRRMRDE